MINKIIPIIGTAAIVIVQSQPSLANNISNVKTIAQQITVKIEPPRGKTGSGVIIARDNNIYYVLTARHVINTARSGEEAYLFTHDGKEHKIDTTKTEKLPNNIDLALLQFESNKDYPVATISQFNYQLYKNNDYENKLFSDASVKQHVFVSGFPLGEQQLIFNPGTLFDNSGSATSYAPEISNEKSFGGYELAYTNLTHPGISGGAVLDTQGRLIGIHGRGDGRKIGEEDEIIREYLDEADSHTVSIKMGLSQGISINNFLRWALNKSVYYYLKVEDTAPYTLDLDKTNIESWQPTIAIADKQNPYHWLEKGNQLWRIGRVAEARGAFTTAIELKEDLYLAWFAKGFASGFDRKYDIALKACDRAIQLKPKQYEAHRCKAIALQQLQRFEPALDSMNEAINFNKENNLPINNADLTIKAELLYALGQYRGALESFNLAEEQRKVQYLPPSPLLHNNRGLVQLELRKYEAALEDIKTAIKLDPNYSPAWINKGLILETMGKDSESLTAYDKAIALDRNDYATWTNRAFVLYKLERYPEAVNSLETALKINSNYQPAINSLEQLKIVTGQ